MDKLLSIKDASDLLGLKCSTLYKYICAKKIPYVKLGMRVLFDPEKLRSWISDHSVEPLNGKRNASK